MNAYLCMTKDEVDIVDDVLDVGVGGGFPTSYKGYEVAIAITTSRGKARAMFCARFNLEFTDPLVLWSLGKVDRGEEKLIGVDSVDTKEEDALWDRVPCEVYGDDDTE